MKLNEKLKIGIRTLVLFSAVGISSAVAGVDYYFQSGKTDFSKTSSYLVDGAEPADLPGADDLVYLPAGEAFEVTAPSASFSALSAAGRIVPKSGNTLVVDVPNAGDVCELSAAFANSTTASEYANGLIKKRGAGTLNLSGGTGGGLGAAYSYFCDLTVEGGVLRLPQETVGTRYVGRVAVSNDASFLLSPEASTTRIAGLRGGGIVTNATATACTLEIRCSWAVRDRVDFSGSIGGPLSVLSNGVGSFLGTNSTFSGSMSLTHYVETSSGGVPFANYILGVANFGREGEPSAIGTNGIVYSNYRGGRFRYLGTGETTDKKFHVRMSQIALSDAVPFEIDGGATGNLVIEGGEFDNKYANEAMALPRILLSGTNANACTVAVPIKLTQTDYPFHIKKSGSGRWEFLRAAKDSANTGAFTVEEGELGYDTLAPVGEACAFGYATKLYKYVSVKSADLPSNKSSYAFTLGGEGTTGTLDYVGTNRVAGTGRLVGLAGTGRFTTSGSGRSEVYFNGVSAIGANAKRTLVLDGAAGTSTFANVTNGEGVVSVVKRGAGTWVLSGETSFSGSLSVEAGRLVVRAPDAPYTWHRLTIKSVWESGANCFPRLAEFAMYRSDGTRCSKNLVQDHSYTTLGFGAEVRPKSAIMELDAGHVSWSDGRLHKVGYTSQDIDKLFDDSASTLWRDYYYDGTDYPVESSPSRWLVMTLRQPLDNGEVVAYDFVDKDLTGTLKSWRIEASQDGVNWTTLTNATFGVWNEGTGTYDKPEIAAQQWYSTLTAFAANRVLAANEGFRIPGRPNWTGPAALAEVSQVFVTSNAVLEAEGSVSIGDLVVDCASGGTIKGFALKPTGTLSLVNVPRPQSGFVLPMTFEGVSGLSNLENWTVKLNGVAKQASVVVKDGVPRVYLPGMMLIVY